MNNFNLNNNPEEEEPPATPPPPPNVAVSHPNRTLITAANLAAALAASSTALTISSPLSKKRSRLPDEPDVVIDDGAESSRSAATAAPEITHSCRVCGRNFPSWKALFGHMRSHPDRNWRGINPPPNFQAAAAAATDQQGERVPMSLDDQAAVSSLLILSGNEEQQTNANATAAASATPAGNSVGHFACTDCDKVFTSHQALGGHRASHKNVKGCYAINKNKASENADSNKEEKKKNDGETSLHGNENNGRQVVLHGDHDRREVVLHGNNDAVMLTSAGREGGMFEIGSSSRMHGESSSALHQCEICWKVFSSGQALGGHKRCHWERDASVEMLTSEFQGMNRGNIVDEDHEMIDLNLPPPPSAGDDDDGGAPASEDEAGVGVDLNLGL